MSGTIVGNTPADTTIDTGGGSYDIPLVAFTANPTITFVGPGVYNVDVKVALFASYTLVATNGADLVVNETGSFLTTSNLVIDGASTISFSDTYSALSAATVDFTGAGGGTLIIPPGKVSFLEHPPVVSNFGLNDNIDFGSPYNSGDTITYTPTGTNAGTLALLDPSGKTIGEVTLLGKYSQSDFSLGQNANGTSEIVNNVPCFLRGTLIATAAGNVPVESLREGDMIMTLSNGLKAAKAVRLRSFTTAAEMDSAALRPVRIAAGALGEGLPRRDLFVSPDHSMFLDGALVPAQLLVNGITITQPENTRRIDYFHVELEPHDIIVAEGAATESYLDVGNRGFSRAGVVALFPRDEPKTWDDACAPLVLGGARLARIQARLTDRAFTMTGQGGQPKAA